MKTCPTCNAEVQQDAAVCSSCGHDIAGVSPDLPVVPGPVRHSGMTMLVIVGLLVLIGIAIVYFGY